MKVPEKIRYSLFWLLDTLKGAPVKNHLRQLDFILNHFHDEKAQIIRMKALNRILHHASATVPYYKNYSHYKGLNDFPVVDKNTINTHYDDFRSESYKHIRTHVVVTSGSTGETLKAHHDKNKRDRNTADTIFFSGLAGYRVGHQLWYVRHWSDNYKRPAFQNWLQNIVPVEVTALKDADLELLIAKLENSGAHKTWLGYPSAFKQICLYLDKVKHRPVEARMVSIIGMSEALDTYTKERMQTYFKAPVVSRYSNTENGILAQQIPNGSEAFLINWASYYLEVLDLYEDKPAKPGIPGRIVITDLYNFAMPFIRYDTGDIGVLEDTGEVPVLKSVEGRKADLLYDTRGNAVSSSIMINTFKVAGIKQSQFIQEKKKQYVLKLVVEKDFCGEKDIVSIFKGFLGEDAMITVDYVNEIAKLSSGKVKTTINNYIREK